MSFPMAVDSDPHGTPPDETELPPTRKSKRSFFRLGKKKKKDVEGGDSTPATATAKNSMPPPASPTPSPLSPDRSLRPPGSPTPAARSGTHPYVSPSPPRLSTSSSQIFERNVQEHPSGASMSVPASPAGLPHLQTENHVPPVLSASSIAITDRGCGVEDVEIVMHSAHQPAVSGLAPGGLHRPSSHGRPSLDCSEDASHHSADDLSSPAADKQRLSFISFADVVQAEQSQQQQQLADTASSPVHGSSPVQPATDPCTISTTIAGTLRKRSPSPMRLTNGTNAAARAAGERGELTIETMGQALRRTGSGDLGKQRSPIGGFDRMA